MNKVCSLAFLLVLATILIPTAGAAGITRSLSSTVIEPGGTLSVTLSVDVSGAGDYYAIDDVYPEGWEVTDSGGGSTEHAGHWKNVVIQDAQNTQYTYTLRAPSQEGTYSFSGEYMFGGMSEPLSITGQDTVTVGSQPMGLQTDTTTMILAVVIVLVVAALVALKKLKRI
jgi:hypothetical protein